MASICLARSAETALPVSLQIVKIFFHVYVLLVSNIFSNQSVSIILKLRELPFDIPCKRNPVVGIRKERSRSVLLSDNEFQLLKKELLLGKH